MQDNSMATGTIFFKYKDKDYQLTTRSDGYEEGIFKAISQLKTFLTAGLLKWEDLYSFVEKYSYCYHIQWFRREEFLKVLPSLSIESIFIPFDDGYGERGIEDSGFLGYQYHVDYKLKTLIYDGRKLGLHKDSKEECQKNIIRFMFDTHASL